MKTFDFFLDYGSPYSYLASTQLDGLVKRTGARVRWRPLLLGALLKQNGTGMSEAMTSMFKAKYLFKDLQDWAAHYGLPPVVIPDGFPIQSIQADRLGLVADEQGKIAEWSRVAFKASFVDGRSVADPAVLSELLASIGMEPEAALARMGAPEIKERLKKNTEEAAEKGAYGVPTFYVGEEMFFGNDRMQFLEKALSR